MNRRPLVGGSFFMVDVQPKIGLSLSGGGARCAAHLGILQALEEADLKPARLVGVSSGSIVGALYAAGKTPIEIRDLIKQGSLFRLFGFGIPSRGLTSLSYLRKKMLEALGQELMLENLPLPFHAGITNLNTGELELRDTGNLIDTVCASCAIPFVFKPVEIDGHQYADGGIVCNMPIEPLQSDGDIDIVMGANLISASNLGPADLSSIWGIMWRSFDLSMIANTAPSLQACDFTFEPQDLNQYNIFAFSKTDEMYEAGYQYGKRRVADLRKYIEETRDSLAAQALRG